MGEVKVTRGVRCFIEPYMPTDTALPARRRLRVFALDPALPKSAGGVATVDIPYEMLELVDDAEAKEDRKRLKGRVFQVESATGQLGNPPALELSQYALTDGLAPTTGNPAFSCQMVYAVAMQVYEQFRIALGRAPRLPFEGMLEIDEPPQSQSQSQSPPPIKLCPDMEKDPATNEFFVNACYDSSKGEIRFGSFDAQDTLGVGSVFKVQTALSADIVAHEVTHALVDGEKPMLLPTSAETVAFHEGFADLVALFLHFTNRSYLADSIERAGGDLTDSLVTGLAREFGKSLDRRATALRSVLAVDTDLSESPPPDSMFNVLYEPHALGSVLVAAMFGAFRCVYLRKSGLLRKLSPQDMSRAKAELFAERLQALAQDFLSLLIRALDYLPPVHVTFSDFLRGVVTADSDLIPDDKWGYRDALIDSFRRFGIPLHGISSYSPDALLWKRSGSLDVVPDLARCRLGIVANDTSPNAHETLHRAIAEAIRNWLMKQSVDWKSIGLGKSEDGSSTILVTVAFARRLGPNQQLLEEYVVQIVQHKETREVSDGGVTLIFDEHARLKYAIAVPIDEVSQSFQGTAAASGTEKLNRGGALLAAAALRGPALQELQRRFARGVGAVYATAFRATDPKDVNTRANNAKKQMFTLNHHHFDHWSQPDG